LEYLTLYLARYWTLALAIPLAGWAVLDLRREAKSWREVLGTEWAAAMVLLAASGLAYAFFIVRMGGDFMYARLLLPCTPAFLALIDGTLVRLARHRPVVSRFAYLGLAIAPVLTPEPVTPAFWVHGIANERSYYTNGLHRPATDRFSTAFILTFHDLPIRMATYGGEAKIAYDTRVPVAIDALTDRTIAHQPIGHRRRPGHEKFGSPEYLIGQRAAHLMLDNSVHQIIDLESYIPLWRIHLAPGADAILLHWDPAVMKEVRARGVQLDDFPSYLDEYLARLDSIPTARLREDLARFRHFYFDWVKDPGREQVLARRAEMP
jgi:hypothetical protein